MCKKMNKKSIIYIMHLTIICIRSIIHIKKGTIFAPLNKKNGGNDNGTQN